MTGGFAPPHIRLCPPSGTRSVGYADPVRIRMFKQRNAKDIGSADKCTLGGDVYDGGEERQAEAERLLCSQAGRGFLMAQRRVAGQLDVF